MNPDLEFAINVMYPAANAAYQIMSLPQPPLTLPPGFTLAGRIDADPTVGAHIMAQATPDQQRIPNAMLAESSIFGLVAWNAATLTAIVAIRGTRTIWEWIADFDAAPVPWFSDPRAGLAHMGFQLVYEQFRNSMAAVLKNACPGVTQIWVTGHSLGGALAVLAAFDLATTMPLPVPPQIYTFAGPRVADPILAGHFDAAIPVCFRVVNFLDVVPQVPLPPLYEHVGQEVLVHGGFRPLDVTYAHHLTTYLAGLQALAGHATAAPVVVPALRSTQVTPPAAATP